MKTTEKTKTPQLTKSKTGIYICIIIFLKTANKTPITQNKIEFCSLYNETSCSNLKQQEKLKHY